MGYSNHNTRCNRGRSRATNIAALGLTLLCLATTPCTGRFLRGDSIHYGSGRAAGGRRRLHAAGGATGATQVTAAPTVAQRAMPDCASVFVPSMAGNLTGTYTHRGRFNDRRPVYREEETGNSLFARINDQGEVQWNLVQADQSARFFLSIESDVLEPADWDGLQPWVRNNDPECRGKCNAIMVITCRVLTDDLYTSAPTASPTAAPTAAIALSSSSPAYGHATYTSGGNETAPAAAIPTPAPTTSRDLVIPTDDDYMTTTGAVGAGETSTTNITATSTVMGGCMNLDITNGGDRTGVYLLNTTSYSNGRPGYSALENNCTDEVFSVKMGVCADGWGVVNATWAETTGKLLPTASVRDVFLMYVAGLGLDAGGGCAVNVWIVAEGGVKGLYEAGQGTFLAVSGVEDPSEVTQWASFAPATATGRSSIENNFRVRVGCADVNDVEAAEKLENGGTVATVPTAPTPTPAPMKEPVGEQSNGRRR